MVMFYAFVALCLSGSALAQVPGFGACPQITTQANFDPNRYMDGSWFEISRYYTSFELNSKCNRVNYGLRQNGTIRVIDSYISGFTGNLVNLEINALIPDRRYPANLLIQYPLSYVTNLWSNKYVLGTDYNNYAVVYSCNEYGNQNTKYAWVLTRTRNPSQAIMNRAFDVLHRNNINVSYLARVNQSDCWN